MELGLAMDLYQYQKAAAGGETGQHLTSLRIYHMFLAWEELIDPAIRSGTAHFQNLLDKVFQQTPAALSAHFLEGWQQFSWHERKGQEQRGRELFRVLLPYWELLPQWQEVFAASPDWALRYLLALKPETSPHPYKTYTR